MRNLHFLYKVDSGFVNTGLFSGRLILGKNYIHKHQKMYSVVTPCLGILAFLYVPGLATPALCYAVLLNTGKDVQG